VFSLRASAHPQQVTARGFIPKTPSHPGRCFALRALCRINARTLTYLTVIPAQAGIQSKYASEGLKARLRVLRTAH
ncbi:hypothetical protein, partial [Dyella choica]|uniref:hypothetical protein n=1 Tax=Dyella choica TaxID=1927959 RepID=UPI001E3784CC